MAGRHTGVEEEEAEEAGRQLLAAPRAPRPLVDEEAGGRNGVVVRLAAAVAGFIYIDR